MLVQKVVPGVDDQNKILDLESCKKFMRILDGDEDDSIQELINSAIAEAQDITNRQFASATYELYRNDFPRENFKFPKNPIQEILSIEYMDLNGVYQTIDPATYYLFKEYEVGKIEFKAFPIVDMEKHRKAVKITFKSGYTTDFPSDLRQWLKVRVSTLYEHREELAVGLSLSKTKHVDNILSRYKIRSL